MKKSNLGANLQGLMNKGGNYRSFYKSNDTIISKDSILNTNVINTIFINFQKKESLLFIHPNQELKLLNNSLKTYLKNIIQELIEHNRRRIYSKYLFFPKHCRIISYGVNVRRDPDPVINEKKNKLFPSKNLTLMRTINVDKKLELLDKYNAIKKNKKIEEPSPEKEVENKSLNNNSESDEELDFFQKNKRKNSEEIENKSINTDNNDKIEYQGILNVHQSHELTNNKLFAFKKFKMGKIELKDLIFYLEENQAISLNKQILYKAYIEMTMPKNQSNRVEENAINSI